MIDSSSLIRPLSEFPLQERKRISAVLTDIDDTLTVDGLLPAKAYAALERLSSAGLKVIPVTGRPAGWCDLIARLWPVDGVVGENGAFYFRYDRTRRQMIRRYQQATATREENRRKLRRIEQCVLEAVPGCRIAADQHYREADLAVDFAEDVPRLSDEAIADIVRLFEEHGACAKVSSIHVNGWFGEYDKLGMARRLLSEEFGIETETPEQNARVAFVGDSPNDEPMFDFFTNSVGVANFAAFAEQAVHPPRWITDGEGGHGFQEFAECLLEAR
ncbi:HAD-IIB family hydrolase [Oricola thermophila]|uniref:HAD-IIB family hydrolase n=1 Tax=Oricola thermophila TaxID=2742145 RepID=UPI0031B636C2